MAIVILLLVLGSINLLFDKISNLYHCLILFNSFFYSGFRWTISQFIMQKADIGIKSPLDMMYFSQPWMLITIFPISMFLEGKY